MTTSQVECTWTTDPATIAAENVFDYAVRIIDEKFGKGYARQHPELIVGFIQATAIEQVAIMISRLADD